MKLKDDGYINPRPPAKIITKYSKYGEPTKYSFDGGLTYKTIDDLKREQLDSLIAGFRSSSTTYDDRPVTRRQLAEVLTVIRGLL